MKNKIKGLTDEEVLKLRKKYGYNELPDENRVTIFTMIEDAIRQPMFLLLLGASLIYFALKDWTDGIIMLVFIIVVMSIEIINSYKSDKSLKELKKLTDDKVLVLRNNKKIYINANLLVPGDIIYLERGNKVPADGLILESNCLEVNQASLNGESEPAFKDNTPDDSIRLFQTNKVYMGSFIVSGNAIVKITGTGYKTIYGGLGYNISSIKPTKTTLQKEIDRLVKVCFLVAVVLFLIVCLITYIYNPTSDNRITVSLLSGVTLAMALIPEEFPVVLAVFLALGAFKLSKQKAMVKKLPSTETLGAISVLCLDKTGTITGSNMSVHSVYTKNKEKNLILYSMRASNENSKNFLDVAISDYAKKYKYNNVYKSEKIYELPFDSKIKFNAITYQENKKKVCYIKGSFLDVIKMCLFKDNEKQEIEDVLNKMNNDTLRVIAVAKYILNDEDDIHDITNYKFSFEGLIAFNNPIRKGVKNDIKRCYEAGINIVMITGDNAKTAMHIAKEIGIKNCENVLEGENLNKLSQQQLKKEVNNYNIYAHVLPDDKLKIITALQENENVVAMIGDGVNDAAALKKADIGIAMGANGTEVAKEAADLVLMDDNLSTVTKTIKEGRRIYDNIKKAMSYIIIIHIPIALSSLVGPLLDIKTTDLLFLPIGVVLLELIIDPTCSIIFERLPADINIMKKRPRLINSHIISFNTLKKSLLVGITIFLVSFITYFIMLDYSVLEARTMGLLIIIYSNIFLVMKSMDNYQNILKDKVFIIINSLIITLSLLIVYLPINYIFNFTCISLYKLLLCFILGFVSIIPYLIFKKKIYE